MADMKASLNKNPQQGSRTSFRLGSNGLAGRSWQTCEVDWLERCEHLES
jgi:hypothetical protein